MTTETKTFIEITDIAGLEFSCPKCQTKVLYPLDKKYDRLADKCPNCYEPWLENRPKQPGELDISQRLLNLFVGIRSIPASPEVKASVRLHVKP
jgi:hypothetical protein